MDCQKLQTLLESHGIFGFSWFGDSLERTVFDPYAHFHKTPVSGSPNVFCRSSSLNFADGEDVDGIIWAACQVSGTHLRSLGTTPTLKNKSSQTAKAILRLRGLLELRGILRATLRMALAA